MTSWLPTLKTATPEDGSALAGTLARRTLRMTQPDAGMRDRPRPVHAGNVRALIASGQVVATHVATAAADDCWRETP